MVELPSGPESPCFEAVNKGEHRVGMNLKSQVGHLSSARTMFRAAVICMVYLQAACICMSAAVAKAPTAKMPAKGAKALGGKSAGEIQVNDDRYNRPVTDKWALIIGISKFKDQALNLNYAAKDAIDFANFLTTRMHFAPDHIKILTDEDATRENILDALGDKFLPRVAGKDDMIVIYLSTHGSPSALDIGKVNYIVAHDTDKDRLYSTGVAMQDLCRIIKDRIQSNRALLILDACHSGAAVPKEAKGMARSGNIDVEEIVQGTGHLVLSSSAPSQVAWESLTKPNSVFTRRLMEGFQANGAETTTLDQAYSYLQKSVEQEVQRDRGYLQTPQLKGKWSGEKLILAARPTDPRPGLRDTATASKIASSAPVVRPPVVEVPPVSTLTTPIPRVMAPAPLAVAATAPPATAPVTAPSTTPVQAPQTIVFQAPNTVVPANETLAMVTSKPRVNPNVPSNETKTISTTPSAPMSPTSSATTIVFSAPPSADTGAGADKKTMSARSRGIAVLPFDGPFDVNTDVSIGFKLRNGGISPPNKNELSVLPESLRTRLQSKVQEILPGMYADVPISEVNKALEDARPLKAMGTEYWIKLGKLLGTKYIMAGSIDEVVFEGNMISGDDYSIKVTTKLIATDSGKLLWKRMKSYNKKIHTGKKDPLDYFLGSVAEGTAEQIVQNIQRSSFKE